MKALFIPLCLLICSTAQADFDVLQSKPLFSPPLANPRSASSGLVLNTSKYKGIQIVYLEGTIGREIPVITWHYETFRWQIGLEATAWITLGVPTDGLHFPLLTQDFHFAFPVSIQAGEWTASLKFNHISAHQGDGFDDVSKATLSKKELKEFEAIEQLANDSGVSVSLIEPLPYSRDYISFHTGYEIYLDNVKIRPYFHTGYIHKIHPAGLDKWFFGNGVDVFYETKWITPFFAQDVTWNGDTNSVDLSVKAGAFLFRDDSNLADIGITFNAFIGEDRRGQLLNRKRMKEFGLGFFVR